MARRSRNNARRSAGRGRQASPDSWPVEGVIEEINETRFRGRTLYNFTLDDDEIYGAGDDLRAEEGDTVRFEAYENNKGYLTVSEGTLEIVDGAPAGRKQSSRGRGRSNGNRSSKGSSDSKRRSAESLQYVDARSAAIAVLNTQLQEGLVSLGPKNKSAQDRLNVYLGMLDDLTAQFYEETETLAALSRAEEARSGGEDEPRNARDADEVYDD